MHRSWVQTTYSRHGGRLRLLHGAIASKRSLLCLRPLLLQGLCLLLLQLLLPQLLPFVPRCSPLDHLHSIQVAVGSLAVHSCLHNSLRGVGGLVLLHLVLLSGTLLNEKSHTWFRRSSW